MRAWRRDRSVAIALALGDLVAACARRRRRRETASLRVAGDVPDASVTIDDQYIGALAYVAAHGVALPPGQHRITVEKAGYFPWDKLVVAKEAELCASTCLTQIPDRADVAED